jgi:hypothetical protein
LEGGNAVQILEKYRIQLCNFDRDLQSNGAEGKETLLGNLKRRGCDEATMTVMATDLFFGGRRPGV